MKIPLSRRLLACCDYVNQGDQVADIGCDHGYLGIHLLKLGVASSVIAADVNEQPLHSAKINAMKYGVGDRMQFYLSDGAANIPRTFDCMVCAGMGADTMISILSAASWLKDSRYRLILQCQSKTPALRRWLWEQGWQIRRETLAKDGHFVYSILEAVYGTDITPEPWEYYVSRPLLEDGSPLLGEYIGRIVHGLRLSVDGQRRSGGEVCPQQEETLQKLEALEAQSHEHGC